MTSSRTSRLAVTRPDDRLFLARAPAPVSDTGEAGRYADAVLAGSRPDIARAITLVESSRPDHRALAQHILTRLLPHAGQARRIGITGVPGVGKSSFIDRLGSQLLDQGHRVAVLAVDPSSSRSGGSILGDKTRMPRLATDPNSFVRPSPTSGTLGGVARATRESLVIMAAAGYDVLLVETVGVGQSEAAVAEMTDTFLLLALARTGQADHKAVPAGPHPVGERGDRHVRLAVPDRLDQRARAPGRPGQIAIEKEQVVALGVVALQQPDRLGAGLQGGALAAAPGVPQHDRARALRHRRGIVP